MNKNARKHKIIAGLSVATLWLSLSLSAAANSPNAVIQEAADLLDQKLTGRQEELASDKDALYALVDEILLPRFDRRYAAQLVLGKHWRTATDEQKEKFVNAFYTVLLQTYADGVLEFDSSRIEILEYRGDINKPRTVVKTIVRLDDGTKVPVNYGLVNRDSTWLVFDVVIEGISYVRNYRTEMNSEVASSSVDAVIERLESEVESAKTE